MGKRLLNGIKQLISYGREVILMGKKKTVLDKYYENKLSSYNKQNDLPFMPTDWKKDLNKYLKDSKTNPNRNKEFEKILKMNQKNLKNYVKIRLENMGYDTRFHDGFVYGKGEIPVMLVAHLDTVHKQTPYQLIYKDEYLFSPQGIGGDDRCGVYMILQIIKDLKCHVLFTEDEEIGCVGANIFASSGYKYMLEGKLNYIIEFDRRNGKDCVFYDCDNPDFESFIVKASGNYFKPAYGSCSDISYIAPALKTAAVNLSCGYYHEHTLEHYINLKEMYTIIDKAKEIIQTESEAYEYIDVYRGYKKYRNYNYGGYYGYDYGSGWDDYYEDYGYGKLYSKGNNALDNMYEKTSNMEIYSPHNGTAMSIYHIIYEESYTFFEKVAEVMANNEDEAVGLFMKKNPSLCYADIIEIKALD